jgi:hypothetical protein
MKASRICLHFKNIYPTSKKTLEQFVWVIDDYDLVSHKVKNEIDLLIGSFPI